MRAYRKPYAAFTEAEKQRHRARVAARTARRAGKLVETPCPCGCGRLPALLEMHHEDYARPLEVVFCCPREHQRRDEAREARLKAAAALAPEAGVGV